jgi:hypothetical protein
VSAAAPAAARTRTHTPLRAEELELAALCGLAHEARDGPEARPSIDAIVDWHDRRYIRAWERKQRSSALVLQVLRETDPARSRRRTAA